MFDFDEDYFMQEEFLYLYYTTLCCNTCGTCVEEYDLPYISGMYDYSCIKEDCGGEYE